MSFRKLIDLKGNRNGTVVRALAFHHCGLGFIPKPGVMWVKVVIGSHLYSKSFSPGPQGFLPPQKPTFQIPI